METKGKDRGMEFLEKLAEIKNPILFFGVLGTLGVEVYRGEREKEELSIGEPLEQSSTTGAREAWEPLEQSSTTGARPAPLNPNENDDRARDEAKVQLQARRAREFDDLIVEAYEKFNQLNRAKRRKLLRLLEKAIGK